MAKKNMQRRWRVGSEYKLASGVSSLLAERKLVTVKP